MIHCREKRAADAVQWNGSNIREMSDFIGNGYMAYINKMSVGDFVIISDVNPIPQVVTKGDFEDFYEIVEG